MATLPDNEIFPNPIVKEVVFQIRFPSLYFIEARIGDLQLKLLNRFPESSVSLQQQFVIGRAAGPQLAEILDKGAPETATKIWAFAAPDQVELQVQYDRINIVSRKHKTYRTGEEGTFREVIEFVLNAFHSVVQLSQVARVGLRYVDECPFPERTSSCFAAYFSSAVDLSRFPVESVAESTFRTTYLKDNINLRFIQSLVFRDKSQFLTLDFDAFAANVAFADLLPTTDKLHQVIRHEFERSIKEPVIEWMRLAPPSGS